MEAKSAVQGDMRRLPGLYRRWEIGQIVEAGEDYRIEDAGAAADGTPLYCIYKHEPDVAGQSGPLFPVNSERKT